MQIQGTSSPGFAVMVAGIRTQQKAEMMHEVLGISGLLSEGLSATLKSIAADSQQLIEGAALVVQADLAGQFIDLLA